MNSFEKQDEKASTMAEENFVWRKNRLEDFLTEEQERLQNFLFEESSILAGESGAGGRMGSERRGDGLGGGVGEGKEIPFLKDTSQVLKKTTTPSHMLQNQNIELQEIKEGKKVFDQKEEKKETETSAKLGGLGKSLGAKNNSQVGVLRETDAVKNKGNWSIGGNEKNRKMGEHEYVVRPVGGEDGGGGDDTAGASLRKPDFNLSGKPEKKNEQDLDNGESGERLRRVAEECKKDQKFLIKVNHAHES